MKPGECSSSGSVVIDNFEVGDGGADEPCEGHEPSFAERLRTHSSSLIAKILEYKMLGDIGTELLLRGQVLEVGNHDELMAREGAYFRLYQAQARNVDTDMGDMADNKEVSKGDKDYV